MGRVRRCAILAVACVVASCSDRRNTVTVDGSLQLLPGAFDFQQVAVHDGKSMAVTLRNVGRGRVDLKSVTVQSGASVWEVELPGGTTRVLPGQDVKGSVVFRPVAPGPAQGTLIVTSDSIAAPQVTAPLSGIGVDAFATVQEQTLDFGIIELGAEKLKPLTVSNPSPLPIQVTARVVGAGGDEFSMAPLTLAPGETRQQNVSFHPQRVGTKRVALAVTPCSGCGDVLVVLTGKAIAQALVANPVDFGQVPTDYTQVTPAVLQNLSTEPVTVTTLTVSGDPDFQPGGTPLPVTVPGLGQVMVDLRYTATHLGLATGTATFTEQSGKTLGVPLRGAGGGAKLCVAPLQLEYGQHAVNTDTPLTVTVRNCGGPGDVFDVTAATLGGAGASQFFTGPITKSGTPVTLPVTLATGESINITVTFHPTAPGIVAATLTIDTTLAGGTAVVQLSSNGQSSPPCNVEVTPTSLDFGTVSPGAGSLLGVKVSNPGPDMCVLQEVVLTNDGGGVFTLPGGTVSGLVMFPGDYFTFEVMFQAPPTQGDFTGQVQVTGTSQTPINVDLKARSQGFCLVLDPGFVDFGVVSPVCPASDRQVSITNGCATPVTIDAATIGAGSTDGEFLFGIAPPVPKTLAPGAGLTLDIRYLAQVPGLSLSPLYIEASIVTEPLLVPLIGESSKTATQKDTFIQGDSGQIDVLFVVDNTVSMLEEQPRLVSAIPTFVDAALASGVDLHVAVTTTGIDPTGPSCPGGASGGEAGRLFPADNSAPRMFTAGSPNLASGLQQDVQVGECAFEQQGLEAMRRALTDPLVSSADDPRTPLPNDGNLGFYRDTAALAVVVVSDDDDQSPDAVSTYTRFLQGLKGPGSAGRSSLYAIAPSGEVCPSASGSGIRYAEAAAATGGAIESVCAADFGPLLRDVVNRAFAPQTRYPLSGKPDSSGVTVTIGGSPVGGWTYDPATNSVVFASPLPPGTKIEVSYTRACG
jgi:hypothetical protein